MAAFKQMDVPAQPLVDEENLDMSDEPADGSAYLTNRDPKLKKPKNPSALRKKKRNSLSHFLAPKSALMLLHELKPGVEVKVACTLAPLSPWRAEFFFEGQILGKGVGATKAAAKNVAAECALKNVVKNMVKDLQNTQEEAAVKKSPGEGEAMDHDGAESTENELSPADSLPWAGLAGFAIYRLFHQWQNEGFDFPLNNSAVIPPVPGIPGVPVPARPRANLPAHAASLHPVSLLHMMHPTAKMEELFRTTNPNSSVTVGYRIEGQLYTGTGQNKKAARKEAAEAVRTALYPQLAFHQILS